MKFQEAVKTCFTKYVDFKGRARRSEYWWFYLFVIVLQIILRLISTTVSEIGALLLLLPVLAVSVRRLHDIGKGGGYIFINFIPLVGPIIWIYWACLEGEKGANRFGKNPKY